MKETQPLEKDEIRHEIPAQHQKRIVYERVRTKIKR